MKSFTDNHVLKSVSVKVLTPKYVDAMPAYPFRKPQRAMQPHLEIWARNKQEKAQILKEAERKAQVILDDARKKAADILKAAQEERVMIKEKIKQEIEAELKDTIIPEAKAQGYAEGLSESKKEAQEIRLQAKQYLDYAQNALAFELKRVDKELLDLSIRISEKIIGVSLELEPQMLLTMIQRLVIAVGKKEKLKICVSQEDYLWLKELPEKIKPAYPIVVDPKLSQGNSYLESEEGIFRGQIDSQLDKIRTELIKVLENDQLAATGSDN